MEVEMTAYPVGGEILGSIHAAAKDRKQETYWIGFLKGLISSRRLEEAELFPLQTEAEHFLETVGDADAAQLLHDLEPEDGSDLEALFTRLTQTVDSRLRRLGSLSVRDRTNMFLGQCAGAACDSRILLSEAHQLLAEGCILQAEKDDSRLTLFLEVLREAVRDHAITLDESHEILDWIRAFVGDCASDTGLATALARPVLPNWVCVDHPLDVTGRPFVVTGTFRSMPRRQIVARLVSLGAIERKAVSHDTHVVFVAMQESRDWTYNQYGTKIESALKHIEAGADIRFASELLLEKILGIAL